MALSPSPTSHDDSSDEDDDRWIAEEIDRYDSLSM